MSELGWLTQPAVFAWVALALGLCVGSFLNVVIHRLPRMMERGWRKQCAEIAGTPPQAQDQGRYNLLVPRSACPSCGRGIRAIENVPVLSWLALRGKCAGCGASICLRYPAVELLAGLGTGWAAWHFGCSLAGAGAALFIWCAIALAFIDQATGYLPDDITLPLMWAGLLLNLGGTYVTLGEALIGAAAGYLSLWSIYWAFKLATGKEGMGYGDFKMNAAVGAFVGWKLLPLVILVSAAVGLAFGVAQMVAARRGWDGSFRFHFGPYIAIAGVVTLFWGAPILLWYLGA
ncbi:MAG: prepilin peptidase [Betaproteobacteria bacterium]|nr:prepilin peptidase [Betaproteobacteria bacterium]